MYKTILMILALLVATLSAPVWAAERCEHPVCFGINWETATPEDVRGIDINARDDDDRTPLIFAFYSNNVPIIFALVKAGASTEVKASPNSHPSLKTHKLLFSDEILEYNPPIDSLIALLESGALDMSSLRSFWFDKDIPPVPAAELYAFYVMEDHLWQGQEEEQRFREAISVLSDAAGRNVNEVMKEGIRLARKFRTHGNDRADNLIASGVIPTPDEAKRIAAELKQEFYEKYGHLLPEGATEKFYEKYGHLLPEGAAGQNQASETSAEKHPSCRYPDQGKRFADSELIELDAVSRTKDKVYQSGECVYGSGMAADAAECVVETKIWEGEFLYTPGSKCKKSVGDISVCTTTNYASDKYRCGIKYHNGYYSSLSDSSPVIKVKDPAKEYKDRFAACFEPYKLMLTKGVDKDEYTCIGDPQNE